MIANRRLTPTKEVLRWLTPADEIPIKSLRQRGEDGNLLQLKAISEDALSAAHRYMAKADAS